MLRTSISIALAVAVVATADSLLAQLPTPPAPPSWRDGASVYLAMGEGAAAEPLQSKTAVSNGDPLPNTAAAAPIVQLPAGQQSAAPPTPTAPSPLTDRAVQYAFHQTDTTTTDNDKQRHLAPPTVSNPSTARNSSASSGARNFRDVELPWKSASTMIAALAIVVGAFLLCAWLFRRGASKAAAALPRDVVSVLGRVPLAARHVAQLLRVGNKLVLVSLTPAGAQTLTEVTDPAEVDRLVGLCQQSNSHSTTKAFEHVFRQLSREPSLDEFLGEQPQFGPQMPTFEARRAYRGDAVRG